MNYLPTDQRATDTNSCARNSDEDVQTVLLAGGLGTRMRCVTSSTPKPLLSVGKTSFLELLVRQLRSQGIRRLIMCTGYLADQIEIEFGDGRRWDVAIVYSKESSPLGTAGAVKLARHHLGECSDFLVMNADSFLEVDFRQLIRFHRDHGGIMSMAALRVKNASRYGTVEVDNGNRVVGFREKTGKETEGLVNAGVYVFRDAIFEQIPEGPCSLETAVFPKLLELGVYAMEQHGMFIDIGTPEDYARAQQICDRLYQAALQK